jgi:hypothetical protein
MMDTLAKNKGMKTRNNGNFSRRGFVMNERRAIGQDF